MNLPEDLKYNKEHQWARIDGDIAYVGITDFAQNQLGDIVYVDVEKVDETVAKDEEFGSIEAVKTVSDIFMPLSGEIIELNEKLEDDPELINTDPYNEGWIIKVKFSDITEQDTLLTAAKYKNLIEG